MFFPQPRKRAVPKPQKATQDLSSPEKVQQSFEQNAALSFEAKREKAQNEAEAGRIDNDDKRFTLFQRRVVFGFELLITVLCLVALAYFAATDPDSIGTLLSGGGSFAGIASLLRGERRAGRV